MPTPDDNREATAESHLSPSGDVGEATTEAQTLGRAYAEILRQTEWHVDELPSFLLLEPGATSALPSFLPQEPGTISATPHRSPQEAGATQVASVSDSIAPEPTRKAGQDKVAERDQAVGRDGDAARTPTPPQAPAAEPIPPSPEQILEAMCFAGGTPLTVERACEILRGLTPELFLQAMERLNQRYRRQNRPYHLVSTPTGWIMILRGRYAAVRERLLGSPREARLAQPALDTLALIAYRQPISKSDIDTIRGVDSSAVVRQLIRLGLVASTSAAPNSSGESLYVTTARFLQLFGLRSLDDLPQTGDLQQI